MRPALFLGLAALGLATIPARADTPADPAEAAEAPALAALPSIIADERLEHPARIEPAEQVHGIWTSVPREVPSNQNRTQSAKKGQKKPPPPPAPEPTAHMMTVAPGPITSVLDHNATPRLHLGPGQETSVCLRTSRDGVTWRSATASAVVLESAPGAEIYVDPTEATREQISESVWIVRSERLVLGEDDRASIEAVDAWVDLRTGGAREARRSVTPLSLVERLPSGLAVYGARLPDNRAIFAVRPPPAPRPGAAPATDPPPLKLDAGEGQPGHCSFARVEMTLEGDTQAATDLISGEIAARTEDDPDAHTVRVRPFRVSLGLSRAAADKPAAVSVSFGWTGRTRIETRDP